MSFCLLNNPQIIKIEKIVFSPTNSIDYLILHLEEGEVKLIEVDGTAENLIVGSAENLMGNMHFRGLDNFERIFITGAYKINQINFSRNGIKSIELSASDQTILYSLGVDEIVELIS